MTWRKDRKESHMCNWEHEMAIEREREREREREKIKNWGQGWVAWGCG